MALYTCFIIDCLFSPKPCSIDDTKIGKLTKRKEGLEPSTSALARLYSTIKLFLPAPIKQ